MTTQMGELRLKGCFVGVIVVIGVLAKNADSLRHCTPIGSRAPPSAPILRPLRSTRQATGPPQRHTGNPVFRPQMANVTSAHERPRAGARRATWLREIRQVRRKIREAASGTARFTRTPAQPTAHRLAHSLLSPGIVKSTRAMLSAIVLIAAVITSTGASALAVQAHPSCATHRHECGKIARITKCCDDQDAARTDSTPVQPRVEVRPDLSAAPALPSVAPFAEPQLLRPVQPSPPRLCLLDLPTLYATFLI